MKMTVDKNACIGCGACVGTCDKVFGFEDNYDITINLSEQPKIEVASGMITERPRHKMRAEDETNMKLFGDTEDEYILSSVLSGEKFTINGIKAYKDDFGETVSENNGFGGCINNLFKELNPQYYEATENKNINKLYSIININTFLLETIAFFIEFI